MGGCGRGGAGVSEGALGQDGQLDGAAPLGVVQDPGAVLVVRPLQESLRERLRVVNHRARDQRAAGG